MILDGATLDPAKLLVYDICIVGAGAVGISMAHRLWNSGEKDKGKKIVVLDSGIKNRQAGDKWSERRWYDPAVLPLDSASGSDWISKSRPEFFTSSRTRCYGGSTNCWGGFIRPLDTYDFTLGEWPISREYLNSYYVWAMQLVGLKHFELFDDARAWKSLVRSDTPIDVLNDEKLKPVGLKTIVIQQQTATLALDFQEQFGLIFESPHTNLDLIRNATALNLQCGAQQGPVVEELECGALTSDGSAVAKTFTVKATNYVLGMGGLEIPHFLLNNKFQNFRIGQLQDVGKYYMNHPKYVSAASGTVVSPEFSSEALRRFYANLVTLRQNPTACIQAYIVPTEDALKNGLPWDNKKRIKNFRIGLGLRAVENQKYNFNVEINFEQQANKNSVITLDTDKDPDVFGQKKLRLDWQFAADDALTVANSMEMMYKLLSSFGPLSNWEQIPWTIDYIYPPVFGPNDPYTGDHHIGTCRMRPKNGKDREGVVDSDCKVIGFDNLYICSTAVFPSGGWANSTATLLALALRLADHLGGSVPAAAKQELVPDKA